MKITPIILAVMTLTACLTDPDMTMQKHQRVGVPTDGGRIIVERIGVFVDDLAYGARRGVYVIRDKDTGREFIGVSGVGIAETGSHQSGKVSVSDER